MIERLEQAVAYIRTKTDVIPEVAMIMGSGLGVIGDMVEHPVYIEYQDIPNFPVSTVAGHKGRFVLGDFCGKKVIVMQGRFHYYEGYSMEQITLPVRLMYQLGARKLIVTNAAGGVNESFTGGALVLIKDHINLMGISPLIGPNMDSFGARFPDMSNIYDKTFNERIRKIAYSKGIDLQEGVYFYFTGPQYETPAEIRLVRQLGGDLVGMSTVPETIVAAHMKMRVTGISCVTNMAAGVLDQEINHEEVMETARQVQDNFIQLVKAIVELS